MRVCTRCGESKSLDRIHFKPDERYVGGFRPQCRACASAVDRARHIRNPEVCRASQRKYRGQQRAKLVEIKLARGCVDCGYAENAAALDFDHLPGEEKLFNISRALRPWADVLKEIAKCEVVCANCHRIRTATRASWYSCKANGYTIVRRARSAA